MNLKNILLLISMIFISNNQLKACSCLFSTIEKEVEKSDKILTGKILSKEIVTKQSGFQLAKYTLEVKKVLKGNITKKKVGIYTGFGGGDCGICTHA